ncbi:HPr family phosphocarrier protein [bacterium]|nr:HPr family phosphocarrier protein [bacterium]MCP5462605.1 HPr family phosphocarrier protein [bacterium]
MTDKAECRVVIKNKNGIHARPAAMFVQQANKFESDIFIVKDSVEVNGKSIIGIMTLAASYGTKLKLRASGPDAKEAITSLTKLFNEKFGEQ